MHEVHFHGRPAASPLDAEVQAVIQELAVVPVLQNDRFEPAVWLDRAAVLERFGREALLPHEAETWSYLFAQRLWTRLAMREDEAWIYLAERQADPKLRLTLAVGVIRERDVSRVGIAAESLVAAAAWVQGDPNIGRLELQLRDLARGTDRFEQLQEQLRNRHCGEPWRHLETAIGGNAYLCCPAWLPRSIGNMFDTERDLQQDFQGPVASEVRRTVADGSFRYCNWSVCPRIAQLPERPAALPEPRPVDVYLSHDPSCNLSCPSCRRDVIAFGGQERAWVDRTVLRRMRPLVEGAERLKVTGSGDPFASRHFRTVIESLAHIQRRHLYLHTNGLLFDDRAFARLQLQGRIARVEVSIDAASEGTYRRVRRGGDFTLLLERLGYIAGLRDSGEIPELQLDFVVQSLNFREMPAFVELGQRFRADRVYFSPVRNWHAYSAAEFVVADIASEQHPEHADFLDVLTDQRLVHPAVDMGALRHLLLV